MNNTETLRADFRDWLSHPLTDTFVKIITKQHDNYLNYASQQTFNTYYKKDLSEQATLGYGKADGIKTILAIIENCKPSLENPIEKAEENIEGLFQETFGGEND